MEEEIRSVATEAGRKPPQILGIKLDVEDRDSVDAAAKAIESRFGRLDILINNAGYLEPPAPITDSEPENWWKAWTVNIRGLYLVTRAILPLMLKNGDKQIINMSSAGALLRIPGMSAYQTGKLAVIRFSEFINAEYEDKGVLSYSLHPGSIATELAVRMPEKVHAVLQDTPELAADTIVYLTQQKQEWLAGRYVNCQWDMPELFARRDEICEKDLLKVRLAVE